MYVHGSGIADIFITPDMIQELFPGEYLIGRGCQKVKEFQLLWRHLHVFSLIDNGIIGQVDGEIRVFHTFSGRLFRSGRFGRFKAAQDSFDSGYQFFGIKGFDHIIIGAKFQSQHFIEDFSFGREHDNGDVGFITDFPADLISVDARKHQIQKDQVGRKSFKSVNGFFTVIDDHTVKTFLGKIKGNQLCNIVVVVNDQDFLFC